MPFLFEKLDVYQKSVSLVEEISSITEEFPKGNYYLVDQLNRAILSVPLNIAEGNGRFHSGDRTNFFRIARGSAFECIPILEICRRKKLITETVHITLKERLDEVCKMISGLIDK